MTEPEIHHHPHAKAEELRFDCTGCRLRLLGVRGRGGKTLFYVPPDDGDPRADPIHACPRCKRPLPPIAWADFEAQVWGS